MMTGDDGLFGRKFELKDDLMHIIEEFGRHMPGGFIIYKEEEPEQLLYANEAAMRMFGCADLDEFRELTGFTFRGMLHPDDYAVVSESIKEQIRDSEEGIDCVEYRIICRDGTVKWVEDYGHYTETDAYGGIYYVFLSDITERHLQAEREAKRIEDENRRRMQEVQSAAEKQELESRLALQEKLIEEQNKRVQQDRMITALASDYRSVYHVDLDKDDAVCYRADPDDTDQTPEDVHFKYVERFTWYADNSVD
ncbi:MAG: PAS domain-containing protein [Oscillospiraceae bacterium]|nr:PAS domain-containing protein [Oscillospiraceae bacterium]